MTGRCSGGWNERNRNHPFSLYASVLMTNPVHRLPERQRDPLSRIRQRLLMGCAHGWNRKLHKVGHLSR